MKKRVLLALAGVVIAGAGLILVDGPWRQEVSAALEREELAWLKRATGWLGEAVASTEARHYVTAAVERGAISQVVSATGTLNAVVTVSVGTQLSGQLAELYADFNDEVERGQPLAQLDRKGFEARLAEGRAATNMAKAAVEVQRAKLERARINARDAEAQRPVLQARVDNAAVRLAAAESALRRIQRLAERGATSASQVEEAQTARDSAAASLREAEAIAAAHELAVAGAEADLEAAAAELANAEAGVPQKEAAERSAAIDLERTTIRSPVTGIVVGRNVDEGQTVAASLEAPTLFTIAGDLQQMEIHASVDEADIGKIKVGQEAVFTVDAHPGHRFRAQVASVRKAPQLGQGVVTYTVVLSTENPDSLLLPGMTAMVRITVHQADSVLKVPMAALRYSPADAEAAALAPASIVGGRPATVWRLAVAGGTPEAVPVVLGNDDGSHAVLLDGLLKEGDGLVVREVVESSERQLFGIRLGF
jgi:HlyD family secretion protein